MIRRLHSSNGNQRPAQAPRVHQNPVQLHDSDDDNEEVVQRPRPQLDFDPFLRPAVHARLDDATEEQLAIFEGRQRTDPDLHPLRLEFIRVATERRSQAQIAAEHRARGRDNVVPNEMDLGYFGLSPSDFELDMSLRLETIRYFDSQRYQRQ